MKYASEPRRVIIVTFRADGCYITAAVVTPEALQFVIDYYDGKFPEFKVVGSAEDA